jgi:serine protease Do
MDTLTAQTRVAFRNSPGEDLASRVAPTHRSAFARCALFALLALAAPARAQTEGRLPPPPTTSTQHSLLVQVQEAFTKIAATVEPSVVNIKAERVRTDDDSGDSGDAPSTPQDKPKGGNGGPSVPPRFAPRTPRRSLATGSGVIIRPDGYILTNDHVVEGADNGIVTVTLYDGREFKGKVYPDFRSDLAVVKIDAGDPPLPTATFADSAAVKPGQWAIAVGSPFGLTNTMTVGVISAVGRHQTIPGESRNDSRYYPELIQTDAAINPGNSGGPLFNIDGQIVGINVAIESPVEGSAGVGFAIPSRVAQQIMNLLISKGSVARGYLGVAPDDLTPNLEHEFAVTGGAFVRDVKVDSPAGKAGLQAGDVVTSFDGKDISDEVSLREAISSTAPGKSVRIDYIRAGVPSHLDVTITAARKDNGSNATPTPMVPAPQRPKLGLTVRDLTAQDRQANGFDPSATGAYISAVEPGSSAEEASYTTGVLLTGTVVQKVGRTTVHNAAEFKKAIDALGDVSETTLVVLLSSAGEVHQSAITVHL